MADQNAALFDKLDGFYVTKSEHDWLERRFSNMTEKEKILFQGAMELEKPQEIGHVMRIASQLDCYDLFYGAGDEAALGKFVMESIECSSDAARPFLNAEHLGAAYHQSQKGAFCNGHYVRNIKLVDPFVEEDSTLQPVTGDYAIRIRLASRSNMEGVWVGFPDSGEYIDSNHPDELLLGLDALQAESLSECIALEVDCCLPQLTGILDQYDSASELVRHAIDFGYVWAEQGQGAPHWLDKWQAVLELIAENDPMLNSYLRGTQAYYDGRRVLIECSDDFRDFMRRSKETSKNIKQYIYQVTHIKCGIGPYEKTAAAVSNAPAADVEETLRQMKDLGVDVVVEDK